MRPPPREALELTRDGELLPFGGRRSPPASRIVFILALVALVAAPALAVPRLELDDHRWLLSDLPPILADEEVKEHLETGLTTSLAIRLTARDGSGRRREGGARVMIRYELWDEVYHVAELGIDGRLRRSTAPDFDRLLEWWRGLRLAVLDDVAAPGVDAPSQTASDAVRDWQKVRVTLDVVPFSQAERDDAERWFSDTLEQAGKGATDEIGVAGEERAETLSRTFQLLLATSIGRRAVTTYRWSVDPPGARS